MLKNLYYKVKYFIKGFSYLKAYNSPFLPLKLKWYFGKIAIGTPYFLPRRWVKHNPTTAAKSALKEIESTIKYNKETLRRNANKDSSTLYLKTERSYEEIYNEKLSYLHAIPRKIGFDFVSLGWKTKWTNTDYRFEWSPKISFVFFGYQICLTFVAPNFDHYWECWLYYNYNTDKTKSKEERIIECMKGYPCVWSSTNKDGIKTTTNYYKTILKKRYLKYIK